MVLEVSRSLRKKVRKANDLTRRSCRQLCYFFVGEYLFPGQWRSDPGWTGGRSRQVVLWRIYEVGEIIGAPKLRHHLSWKYFDFWHVVVYVKGAFLDWTERW